MSDNRVLTFESIFQSTPPARGATYDSGWSDGAVYISIHAPREGGDNLMGNPIFLELDFNPRPPRGGRHALGV